MMLQCYGSITLNVQGGPNSLLDRWHLQKAPPIYLCDSGTGRKSK